MELASISRPRVLKSLPYDLHFHIRVYRTSLVRESMTFIRPSKGLPDPQMGDKKAKLRSLGTTRVGGSGSAETS